MGLGNALNINTTVGGILSTDGAGHYTASPLGQYNILAGETTTGEVYSISPSTSGYVLTSNGASAYPSFQAASGSAVSVNIQTFTTSGTYTPTTGMKYCIVEAVGGGGQGGGAGSTGSGNVSGGGGGGGGEYARGVFSAATIGASQTITIGAGGTGATGGITGNQGGTTSIGSLMTAVGGLGGVGTGQAGTIFNAGGAGGSGGTGGNFHTTGMPGITCIGVNGGIITGAGGSSFFGGGAPPEGGNIAALAGSSYGGGGGGAANGSSQGSTINGGAGAKGIVVITEFI